MMIKMPNNIKRKIRRLNKLMQESCQIQDELTDIFESYRIDINYFLANANVDARKQTEALANILNGQIKIEQIEESIAQIEQVFLAQAKEENDE